MFVGSLTTWRATSLNFLVLAAVDSEPFEDLVGVPP